MGNGEKFSPRDIRREYGVVDNLDGWEDNTSESVRTRIRYVKQQLERHGTTFDKTAPMLEIGSGTGLFLKQLKDEGADIVGVDVRPRAKNDVPQVLARVEQLPFGDATFQYVFSASVFDTLVYRQDQEKMLEEIVRVLKPGGYYMAYADFIDGNIPSDLQKLDGSDSHAALYRKIG